MTAIRCQIIKPTIGVVVFNGREELLSGTLAGEIRKLLELHGVVVFPQIAFSEAEQIQFTRTLGDYVSDYDQSSANPGAATHISIDPRSGQQADYTRSSFYWHFDGYMNTSPILASLLSCVQPSPVGGNTEFCSTYAAWEGLSPDHQRQLEGLKAVHALAAAQLSVEPEPSFETFSRWLRVRHNVLPIVWTHRSGRKSLVIGNTALNVVGMDPLQGLEILVRLRDWATQERFRYSHRWSVGDAVLWDNTGTLHRATPYDAGCGRSMRRTKLAGEEPVT